MEYWNKKNENVNDKNKKKLTKKNSFNNQASVMYNSSSHQTESPNRYLNNAAPDSSRALIEESCNIPTFPVGP